MKNPKFTQAQFNREADKAAKLISYMKARAEFEKVPWSLDQLVEVQFVMGVRSFFGVELDDDGALLSDQQQPQFFKDYTARVQDSSAAQPNVGPGHRLASVGCPAQ